MGSKVASMLFSRIYHSRSRYSIYGEGNSLEIGPFYWCKNQQTNVWNLQLSRALEELGISKVKKNLQLSFLAPFERILATLHKSWVSYNKNVFKTVQNIILDKNKNFVNFA